MVMPAQTTAELDVFEDVCKSDNNTQPCALDVTGTGSFWRSNGQNVNSIFTGRWADGAASTSYSNRIFWRSVVGPAGEAFGYNHDNDAYAVVCTTPARTCSPGCRMCRGGTYHNAAADTCDACPHGGKTDDGATAVGQCGVCPSQQWFNPTNGQCDPCPVGWYAKSSVEAGRAGLEDVCEACPAGEFGNPQQRGQFFIHNTPGQTSSSSCRNCPDRMWALQRGSQVCTPPYCPSCADTYWLKFGELAGCDTKMDKCSVMTMAGFAKCFDDGEIKPKDFPNDVHSSCYNCQPSVSRSVMTFQPGIACNDSLACTVDDTCTNGLCKGTLYKTCLTFAFTRDAAGDCEDCDGVGGCHKRPSYPGAVVTVGSERKCGCRILEANGTYSEVPHGTINPDNQCTHCNVIVDPTKWLDRADGTACQDGDACTYDDVCKTGTCTGVPYSCDADECHASYTCDGDGACISVLHTWASATPCGPLGESQCRQRLTCDGQRASCPPYSPIQPAIQPVMKYGSITIQYGYTSVWANAGDKLLYSAVSFQEPVRFKIDGFDIACDALTARWGIAVVKNDADESSCNWAQISAVDSIGELANDLLLMNATSASDLARIHGSGPQYTHNSDLPMFLPYDNVPGNTSGVSLPSTGRNYKAILEISNVEGDRLAICSRTFTVDGTAPQFESYAGVREVDVARYRGGDPLDSIDVDYQRSPIMTVKYDGFVDPQSSLTGLLKYQMCVTTGSDSIDMCSLTATTPTKKWFDVPNTGIYTYSSFNMEEAVMHKVHIRAVNSALLSSSLTSDGITYDPSRPPLGNINDGDTVGVDRQYSNSPNTLFYNWQGFEDPGAPIVQYRLGVGTVVGRYVDNTVAFVELDDLIHEHSFDGLTLSEGTWYYGLLQATNEAGLMTAKASNGIMIDRVLPTLTGLRYLAVDAAARAGQMESGYDPDTTAVTAQFEQDTIRVGFRFVDAHAGLGMCSMGVGVEGNHLSLSGLTPVNVSTFIGQLDQYVTTEFPGLSLPDGTKVVATLKCCDRAGNCVTQDLPPLSVDYDAPLTDTAYLREADVSQDQSLALDQTATAQSYFQAIWGGFTNPKSGMATYDWAVSSTPVTSTDKATIDAHNYDVLPWTKVGSLTAVRSDTFFNLTHGQYYHVSVRAWGDNGLSNSITSANGIIHDTSQPEITGVVVRDGPVLGQDMAYQPSIGTLDVNWDEFPEPESAIRRYEAAVRWCDNGDPTNYDALNWIVLPEASIASRHATINGLTLTRGLLYCVSIRAVNFAELTSDPVEANSYMADDTAAVTSMVYIGDKLGYTIRYQPNTTVIKYGIKVASNAKQTGWWDPESGLEYYEYCVSDAEPVAGPNCALRGWTNVGNGSMVTIEGLSMTTGTTTYVSVRMTNRALIVSDIRTSEAVVIDATGPVVTDAVIVVQGPVEAGFISESDTVNVDWEGVQETDATHHLEAQQLIEYAVSIGSAPGQTDIMTLTKVGYATRARFDSLALSPGVQYYATVLAYSSRGQVQSIVGSAPFRLDFTESIPGTLTLTQAQVASDSTMWITHLGTVTVEWAAFQEPESRVRYEVALGTTPYGQQLVEYVDVGNATTYTFNGLRLQPGTQIMVSVLGTNGVGQRSLALSIPATVDPSPPRAGAVLDGPRAGVDALVIAAQMVGCSWDNFEDDISGIDHYEVAFSLSAVLHDGEAPGLLDWQTVQPVSPSDDGRGEFSTPLSSLSNVADKSRVFCHVQAVNRAGLITRVASNGAVLVQSGPSIGQVLDGPNPFTDIDHQADCSALAATWLGFSDPSGIRGYEVAVSTGNTTHPNVVGWTKVGLQRMYTFDNISLPEETAVVVLVRATNNGARTSVAASNGVLCDHTAPMHLGDATVTGEFIAMRAAENRLTCECVDLNNRGNAFTFAFNQRSRQCECPATTYWNVTTESCTACADLPGTCDSFAIASPGTPCFQCARDSAAFDLTAPGTPAPAGACGPGEFYHAVRKTCVICPYGTFKPFAGNDVAACLPCASGTPSMHVTLRLNNLTDSTSSHAGSGLSHLIVSAGTTLDSTQLVRPFAAELSDSEHNRVDLAVRNIGDGTRVHFSLTAIDTAGMAATSRIVAAGPTLSKPTTAAVWDTTPTTLTARRDAKAVADRSAFAMAWTAWTPPSETAPVVALYCSFGTSPGEANVVNWFRVPADALSCTGTAATPVADGTVVYGNVEAFTSSAVSAMLSTNGALVDSTPPSITYVSIGQSCDTSVHPVTGEVQPSEVFQSTAAAVAVCWAAVDHESGPATLTAKVRILDVVKNVGVTGMVPTTGQRWVVLDASHAAQRDSSSDAPLLQDGHSYVAQVTLCNAAAVCQVMNSTTLTIDTSKPMPTNVHFVAQHASYDGKKLFTPSARADPHYQTSDTTLRLAWQYDTTDTSIAYHNVSIGRTPLADDVVRGMMVSSGARELTLTQLQLLPGQTYYATLTATDVAGNEWRVVSSPMVVDPVWSSPKAPYIQAQPLLSQADANEAANTPGDPFADTTTMVPQTRSTAKANTAAKEAAANLAQTWSGHVALPAAAQTTGEQTDSVDVTSLQYSLMSKSMDVDISFDPFEDVESGVYDHYVVVLSRQEAWSLLVDTQTVAEAMWEANQLLVIDASRFQDPTSSRYLFQIALDATSRIAAPEYVPGEAYVACILTVSYAGVWSVAESEAFVVAPARTTPAAGTTLRHTAVPLRYRTLPREGAVNASIPDSYKPLYTMGPEDKLVMDVNLAYSQRSTDVSVAFRMGPQYPLPVVRVVVEVWDLQNGRTDRLYSEILASGSLPSMQLQTRAASGEVPIEVLVPAELLAASRRSATARVIFTDVFGRNSTADSNTIVLDDTPPQLAGWVWSEDSISAGQEPAAVIPLAEWHELVESDSDNDWLAGALETVVWLGPADQEAFSANSLSTDASKWVDAESNILSALITVGTSPFGAQLAAPTYLDDPHVDYDHAARIAPQHLDFLWASAVAENGAHLLNGVTSLLGRFDLAPPAMEPAVYLRPNGDVVGIMDASNRAAANATAMSGVDNDAARALYRSALQSAAVFERFIQHSDNDLHIMWGQASDDGSGLAADHHEYTVSLFKAADDSLVGTVYARCAETATICHVRMVGLELESGVSYYADVSIADNSGNTNHVRLPDMMVDQTPPVMLATGVRDGSSFGMDAKCMVQPSSDDQQAVLSVNWAPATDDESGVVGYDVCFGVVGQGEGSMVDCRSVGDVLATEVPYAESKLFPKYGSSVYATVKAHNRAGLTTALTSSGVRLLCNDEVETCPTNVDEVVCV